MSPLKLRPQHSPRLRLSLLFLLACAVCLSAAAQTADEAAARIDKSGLAPDDAAIQKLIAKGYEAYAKRDGEAIFSLFSERSPYLDNFKQFIRQDFNSNEKVKVETFRVGLLRNIQFEGERATARVYAWIPARDIETGKPAEGFDELDHTLRFVKEDGKWRIWQFIETAEELAGLLLQAKTPEEREAVLKSHGEPFTEGLLRALADQGQTLLEVKGEYEQAKLIFNILFKLGKQVDSPLGYGNAMVGLGDVYATEGDYLRAADNYQQVMKLAELFDSKEGIAAVSVKIGNIHYYQGNYAQALAFYQRSAQIYEELGSRHNIAYPLVSIGNAYYSLNNYTEALIYYQRSLKIYEQLSDRAGTGYLLNRLGDVYAAQGDYTRAIDCYQRSLKIYEELGNKGMIAYSLNGIGNVRFIEGHYREAAEDAARAASLTRESYTPEILWQALTWLGRARRALHQTDEARRALAEAIEVVEKLRHKVAGGEIDRQLFFESKIAPYNQMVDLLVEQNDLKGAFAYAERAKGRMLLDVLRHGRTDIDKTMSAEEREQEKRLNASLLTLNSQLRQEGSAPQPDKARLASIEAQLKTARLEYDAFQTQLTVAHPRLKVERGESQPLSTEEALELIKDSRTALLEYVVTEDKSYLFILTRRAERGAASSVKGVELKVFPIEVKAQTLSSRVMDFRQKLASNTLDFREAAARLYELLLKPAQAALEGKSVLGIVPAGPLWELPFQALLSGRNRYVLEDRALFYVPSLSVLREMKRKVAAQRMATSGVADSGGHSIIKASVRGAPAQQVLLAFGNPQLSNNLIAQARAFDRDSPLGSLPEAEREVKTLREIYGPSRSKVLTGAAAEESIVKAEAGNYRVLHFATHGTFDNDNPLYSRLLLANSSASEDGFLEAREIMKLNLRAELVVLSACQTARGRISAGEGLIGMSWAMFVAGTPVTVASQWKVDSASTSRLMVAFHRLLSAESSPAISKAEALRRAALTLMTDPKYKHPFYWAGFVVVGNGL